eukprot:2187902-Amphidinium_carterae.1
MKIYHDMFLNASRSLTVLLFRTMCKQCQWSLATQQRCPNHQGGTRAHCIVANKTVSQKHQTVQLFRGNTPRRRHASDAGGDHLLHWSEQLHGDVGGAW